MEEPSNSLSSRMTDSSSRNYTSRTSRTNTMENIQRESIVSSFQAWLQNHALRDIVLPAMRFLFFCLVFTFISTGVYAFLYLYLMPKALVKEPLYFDYSVDPPTGRLNLLSAHKQWEYMSGSVSAGSSRPEDPKDTRRFLRSDFEYTVDIAFELSKSNRNFDIGKFMAHLSLFDNLGNLVAKSSRPVVMPYQSIVSLTLDSLVKYPFRLLGFCGVNEVTSVYVPMMTKYREPRATFTDSIELTLSSDKADIGTVEVTIMPVLRGLVYFMWYFPVSTAVLCISIMMGFQLSLYMVYIVITFLISYLFSDDDEGEGNGAGSRTYTSVARTSSLGRVEEEEQSSVKDGDDYDDNDDVDEQAGSETPFTEYTSRRSDALSGASSSSSSGSSETSDSYNIVDDTSSAADADTSGNEIEAVLIDEAAGDNPNLRKRK